MNPTLQSHERAEIGNEESYHSGAIRLLAYMSKDASPYYGKTVLEVTTGIANAKNKLANASLTYPITTSQGSAFANGDSSGVHLICYFILHIILYTHDS
jgi:hypothetical protein